MRRLVEERAAIVASAGRWNSTPQRPVAREQTVRDTAAPVDAAGAVAAPSAAPEPSTAHAIPPLAAANGRQIAIKVGFRLGTLHLPYHFEMAMTYRLNSKRK